MDDTNTLIPDGGESFEQPAVGGLSKQPSGPHADLSPEAHLEPGGEDRGGFRQQRTVPYGALAEERARRKELQRELQNAAEAQQRLQGRLDLLRELAQQQAATATEAGADAIPPGLNTSPQESPLEPPVISEAEAQADAALRTQLMHSVRGVMHERPDFLAAYQHARQARVSELCALGYAPHEALEITFDNEAEIIRNAYANGRNPAQVIYDYAQRHGYRGGPSSDARRGAGSIVPNRGVAMTEAEKVALAARGQAASKSLSAAGGGATGVLTLEALAGMSDEEFAEATKGDRWQKLLKG